MEQENPKPAMSPGEMVRAELKSRGWTQDDLARILERPTPRINELIQGKLGVTPELAVALAAAFGTTAEHWLHADAAFRLANADTDSEQVRRRARIYELGPIRDMQKRGWIGEEADFKNIEKQVVDFFEIKSIHDEPAITGVMRKTAPETELTKAQQAWYFRIRGIARQLTVMPFREEKLADCKAALRKLAAFSAETAKVPKLLAMYGIRFVIVEPLQVQGGKIDGVATWIDDRSPVIGLSMRFERIDNFWFNLFHEFTHVVYKDESVDTDLFNVEIRSEGQSPIEARADREASLALIPDGELDEFILRYGPLYSKEKINRFANKVSIHPGIVVGQLQHRGKIGYSANREMLVKVRDIITPHSVTDGWDQTLDERTFKWDGRAQSR